MQAADPRRFGLGPDRVEILGRRNAHSKHFRNPDGTVTAVFQGGMHYQDDQGNWEDLDRTFRPEGVGFVADRLPFMARVRGSTIEGVAKNGRGIRFTLPSPPQVAGRSASFKRDGIDWEYRVTATGLKLLGQVAAPQGQKSFLFNFVQVGPPEPIVVNPDGSVSGPGFWINQPVVIGRSGRIFPMGGWELIGTHILRFHLDDAAIPPDEYPYEIDPTTNFSSPTDGVTTDSPVGGSVESASTSGTTIKVESSWNANNTTFMYLSWDTSSIPDSATIISAAVDLVSAGSETQADFPMEWRIIYFDWGTTLEVADHAGSFGSATTAYSMSDFANITSAAGSSQSHTLSDLSGINKTGTTRMKSALMGTPTGDNRFTWAAAEHATYDPPTLTVTYTEQFSRNVSASAAFSRANIARAVSASIAIQDLNVARGVGASIATLKAAARTVAASLAALKTSIRTVGASLAAERIQTFRPEAEVSDDGWTGNPTDIDESIPSTADYIQGPGVVGIAQVTYDLTQHNLSDQYDRYRVVYSYQKVGTTKTINLTVKLLQGSTEIATWTHNNIGTSWVEVEQFLTTQQAQAITDPATLRLQAIQEVV